MLGNKSDAGRAVGATSFLGKEAFRYANLSPRMKRHAGSCGKTTKW